MWTPALPWSAWEPVYEAILSDFGFDRSADETARDELAALVGDTAIEPANLPDATGLTVAVVGAAGTLQDELELARNADLVVSASAGSTQLREAGIPIGLHVTDLDHDAPTTRAVSAAGVPVAIHAHGDNRGLLADQLPVLAPATVFPTTQAEPVGRVRNPGGFTDGDRAALIAHALGAMELVFPGWDFDDPSVDPVKRHKLTWAERVLYWLERHRDERFAVLDGRRTAIDLAGFPEP